MFKFLRKYNKWILAIGGSLLMVTFIAPQLIQQFGGVNPGQQVVATYKGGEVTGIELRRANASLDIARTILPQAIQNLAIQGGTHWYMLTKVAEEQGLIADAGDGRDLLRAIAEQTALQQTTFGGDPVATRNALLDAYDQAISVLIQERGYTPLQIDLALADLHGIDRLARSLRGEPMGQGILLSAPELQVIGRENYEQARATVALFDAAAPEVSTLPEPTAEQIQQTFDDYRELTPQESEFGIGYFRQPAVAIEWININRQRISNALELDPIEVRKYYARNRGSYPGDFQSSQAAVEAAFRREEVDRLEDAAIRAVRTRLLRATRTLPTEGRFRALPDDWRATRPTMSELAEAANEALAEEITLPITPPVTTGLTTSMMEIDDLTILGDINNAFFRFGNNAIPFPVLIANVRELTPDTPLSLQQGLTFSPIYDGAQNAYFFRITEVRQPGPAPIIDVVQNAVTNDTKRLLAYQELTEPAQLEELETIATAGGATALAANATRLLTNVTITRSNVTSPANASFINLINTPDFRDTVLQRVAQLNPLVPAADIPMEQRVFVVPIPKTLSVAVVEITDQFPATLETVRNAEGVVTNLARGRIDANVTNPLLSPESLAELLDFRVVDPPEDEELPLEDEDQNENENENDTTEAEEQPAAS